MFVDASVLVAILTEEDGYEAIESHMLSSASPICVSPMVIFETTLAIARSNFDRMKGKTKSRSVWITETQEILAEYLKEISARHVAITTEIGNRAIDAAATYGKAVGHRADLNMGDCFAYACAKSENVALLYKGNDFSETDLA